VWYFVVFCGVVVNFVVCKCSFFGFWILYYSLYGDGFCVLRIGMFFSESKCVGDLWFSMVFC